MYCMVCNKHLSQCTCPDLQERLKKISECPNILISDKNKQAYEKQAQRNKDERTTSE